jgi:uncharacterized protein (DUF302 family)
MAVILTAFAVLTIADVAPAGHSKMVSAKFAFQETIARLKSALEAQGFTIVATLDQAAVLQAQGVDAKGLVVLEFVHAKQLKEIYEVDPHALFDLPWKIQVSEVSFDVHGSKDPDITYVKPSAVMGKKLSKQAKEWEAMIEKIILEIGKGKAH